MSAEERYPLALPVGTVLAGQYTIDKVLGQGGFGITYKATDYKTNEKVAIKEFFPDTLAYREMTTVISYPGERTENYQYGKESFLQEAQTLAEFIGCENIVRIHSYFEENGTAYFVMDYIEGKSFDVYLKEKGGKISFEEAKNILVPIMEALAVVHSKGIVHRDVTPDNIYMTNEGIVKLLDFGAARYSLGDKSRSLDVILKHGFAPKEQYTRRGKQGPFTDIYSLGATFYFALTGKRPPDSVERLDEDDLLPPSSLGVQITEYQEEAIFKALNVQPTDRYQSMLEFKSALMNEQPSKVQPTPVVQQFFTAPQQQNINMVNVDMSQQMQMSQYNQTNQYNQIPQSLQIQQKKSKKPLIIAIASIATVLTILSIILAIAIPTMLSSSKSKSSVEIIGNSNGNIQGSGTITEDASYWIDNYRHSIKYRNDDGEIEEIVESDGTICNLIKDGNKLYYILDNTVYIYSKFSKGPVEELEKYSGSAIRLYMSKDYYFVYTYKSGSDPKIHRVSRKTGKEEESIKVVNTYTSAFLGDSFYYVDDSEEVQKIVRVSSLDFDDVIDVKYADSDRVEFTSVTADENKLYYIYKNSNTGYIGMEKVSPNFKNNIWSYELTYFLGDITNNSYMMSTINIVDDQMVMLVYGNDGGGIYHLVHTGSDLKYDEICSPSWDIPGDINATVIDDVYSFYYTWDGTLRYVAYNADGKRLD